MILTKLKRVIPVYLIDYYLFQNYSNTDEYMNDFNNIKEIKKLLKRYLSGRKIDFLTLRNRFIIIINVFGKDKINYIGKRYFNDDSDLYNLFSTLRNYFLKKEIPKNDFHSWIHLHDKWKHIEIYI